MDGHQHGLSTNLRALKISAVLILIYFVFEIGIALLTVQIEDQKLAEADTKELEYKR